MADMKKLVIDGVEYEIIDASVRLRMTDAETDIGNLQSGKADAEDVPSNTSDLTNDAGFITEVPVEGVTIDGTSVVSGKIAAIPRATANAAGVVKIDPSTEAGTQYLDIYAEKENGAEKENRVPLLDANNKILANQLPDHSHSEATYNSAGFMPGSAVLDLSYHVIKDEHVAYLDFQHATTYSVSIPARGYATVEFCMDEDYYSSADRAKYGANYKYILSEVWLSEGTGTQSDTFENPLIVAGYRFTQRSGITYLQLKVYNPTDTARKVSGLNTIVNVIAIWSARMTIPDVG